MRVALVQLLQDSFAFTVAGIEGVSGYVGVQQLRNLIHLSTSAHLLVLMVAP